MTKEEAIKRIKARFDKLALDDKDIEAIQTLIPELRESEDERMLREIKRYIKEQGDKPTGLPNGTVAVYDMIDWLEKQKESLHISETCKENADSFTDEDERMRKEIIEYFKHYSGGDNISVKFPKWIAYLEKQKEQQSEVDVERELDKFYGMYRKAGKTYDIEDGEECVDWKEMYNPCFEVEFARHFYELGKNSK